MISDCSAVVFAGGKSRRMGEDKANVVLADATLLQTAIATVQPLFATVVISVAEPRGALALPQIVDEIKDAGPLAGLCAALAQTTTPWIFALATDMPFVEGALIVELARQRDGVDAVVPLAGGHPQPLLAFYSRNCLSALQARLAGGERSLRGALGELDVRYVDEAELRASDPGLRSFVDLDTPQDLAAARRIERTQP